MHAAREQSFHAIADNYKSLDEVVDALRKQGLESSNLIVAVDFTKVCGYGQRVLPGLGSLWREAVASSCGNKHAGIRATASHMETYSLSVVAGPGDAPPGQAP